MQSSTKVVDCRCMVLQVHLMQKLHIVEVALAIAEMRGPEVPLDALMLRGRFVTLKACQRLLRRLDVLLGFLELCLPCRYTWVFLLFDLTFWLDALVISPSRGTDRFGRPRSGPPSRKSQYSFMASTASWRRCHSASSDHEVGTTRSFSTRRICAGGISYSACENSRSSSSWTADPDSCRSMSMTACFRLNSWRTSFRRLYCNRRRVLVTSCCRSRNSGISVGSWLCSYSSAKSSRRWIAACNSGSRSTDAFSISFRYRGRHLSIHRLMLVTARSNSLSGGSPSMCSCMETWRLGR